MTYAELLDGWHPEGPDACPVCGKPVERWLPAKGRAWAPAADLLLDPEPQTHGAELRLHTVHLPLTPRTTLEAAHHHAFGGVRRRR